MQSQISSQQILATRGARNPVRLDRPYAMLVEPERSHNGLLEDVATIFLTNRECQFRCLMCDLWKNTVPERTAIGAIPRQIRYALNQLAPAQTVKLYNSGNFFDAKAIPTQDIAEIAALVGHFQTVVVENHPKMCGKRVPEFQQQCGTQLEVAMGLETSHEPTLARLNKQMTTADFAIACKFLNRHQIRIRAFILLRPPWTSEQQGIERAVESVRFAYDCGVECCAIIPTRSGNGIMNQLQASGEFQPPQLQSLEAVMEEVVCWKRGRIFADLWDVESFASCPLCVRNRVERLHQLNLTQTATSPIQCDCQGAKAE